MRRRRVDCDYCQTEIGIKDGVEIENKFTGDTIFLCLECYDMHDGWDENVYTFRAFI